MGHINKSKTYCSCQHTQFSHASVAHRMQSESGISSILSIPFYYVPSNQCQPLTTTRRDFLQDDLFQIWLFVSSINHPCNQNSKLPPYYFQLRHSNLQPQAAHLVFVFCQFLIQLVMVYGNDWETGGRTTDRTIGIMFSWSTEGESMESISEGTFPSFFESKRRGGEEYCQSYKILLT